MADFANVTDVVEASWDPIPEDRYPWIESRIVAAENLLMTKVPRLEAVTSLTPLELSNARSAVVNAVLRKLENPKNLKSETVDEQSYTRFDDSSGGGLFFTDEELSWFKKKTKRKVVGNLAIAPFRLGQDS